MHRRIAPLLLAVLVAIPIVGSVNAAEPAGSPPVDQPTNVRPDPTPAPDPTASPVATPVPDGRRAIRPRRIRQPALIRQPTFMRWRRKLRRPARRTPVTA